MIKTLITSGCSFSETISPWTWIETWPKHLARSLSVNQHISKAMGSQGNGLISRSIIYATNNILQKQSAEDLLVGIMWSGPNRQDFYISDPLIIKKNKSVMENPTGFTGNLKNWLIVNQGWEDLYSQSWYKNFYDTIGSQIYTYEHILRTQLFLEKYNVKYFMTTYTAEVFDQSLNEVDEIKHLRSLINWKVFLPVVGQYEWCRDISGLEFPKKDDNHPGTDQHRLFTEKVILPFVKHNLSNGV